MLSFRSPSNHERILAMAMRQIEKMLKAMQSEGKDLSRLKLKKFQKPTTLTAIVNFVKRPRKKMIPTCVDWVKTVSKFMFMETKKADWNQMLSASFFAWFYESSFLSFSLRNYWIINSKHQFPVLVNWH